MFTGIIETVGTIRSVRRERGGAAITIDASFGSGPLVLGESVAMDGPCLTVERILGSGFVAFASSETLTRTTLSEVRPGHRVNLERAMKADGRFGGHLVSGHVDCMGTVRRMIPSGKAMAYTIQAPEELVPFLAKKGSISLNGISLTVNEVVGSEFTLMIIPHTLQETTFSDVAVGNKVNLEADTIARYVVSFLGKSQVQQRKPVTPEMLRLLDMLDED